MAAVRTWWSLKEYNHVPIVRTARKGMCKQMAELLLSQWYKNGHICENFYPSRNASDCSGTKMYHWGALNGLISLMEEDMY